MSLNARLFFSFFIMNIVSHNIFMNYSYLDKSLYIICERETIVVMCFHMMQEIVIIKTQVNAIVLWFKELNGFHLQYRKTPQTKSTSLLILVPLQGKRDMINMIELIITFIVIYLIICFPNKVSSMKYIP